VEESGSLPHSVIHPPWVEVALFPAIHQYGFWKVAVIRKTSRPGAWRHAVPPLFVDRSYWASCS